MQVLQYDLTIVFQSNAIISHWNWVEFHYLGRIKYKFDE